MTENNQAYTNPETYFAQQKNLSVKQSNAVSCLNGISGLLSKPANKLLLG